jgi:hypothetical protein
MISFVDALAVRENVVRVGFDALVQFTGLLEASDASRPELWAMTPQVQTIGLSGDHARPVSVVRVELSTVDDGIVEADVGKYVSLVLDRPMTPWPAMYDVSWTDIYEEGLGDLTSGASSLMAVYRMLERPQIEVPRISRDIANPQTTGAALESVVDAGLATLGTFGTDAAGDYATDQGTASLKKRIVRRLVTRKNAFAHLPGYGVGIPDAAKQLGTTAILTGLRADAESQVLLEPDVARARVVIVTNSDSPSIVRFRVFVQPKVGNPLAFEVPFERAA